MLTKYMEYQYCSDVFLSWDQDLLVAKLLHSLSVHSINSNLTSPLDNFLPLVHPAAV